MNGFIYSLYSLPTITSNHSIIIIYALYNSVLHTLFLLFVSCCVNTTAEFVKLMLLVTHTSALSLFSLVCTICSQQCLFLCNVFTIHIQETDFNSHTSNIPVLQHT
jgi:hypothetical protein